VERGAKLVTLEAMKMETTLYAERAGVVRQVNAERGTRVETGDLLVKLE
jgi:pyruvate carboxylase